MCARLHYQMKSAILCIWRHQTITAVFRWFLHTWCCWCTMYRWFSWSSTANLHDIICSYTDWVLSQANEIDTHSPTTTRQSLVYHKLSPTSIGHGWKGSHKLSTLLCPAYSERIHLVAYGENYIQKAKLHTCLRTQSTVSQESASGVNCPVGSPLLGSCAWAMNLLIVWSLSSPQRWTAEHSME